MRKKFLTEYKIDHPSHSNDARYSYYLLANDLDDANDLISIRNLNEKPMNNGLELGKHYGGCDIFSPPEILLKRLENDHDKHTITVDNLLHLVCSLVNLGRCSGRYVLPEDSFADHGLIHELIHLKALDLRWEICQSDKIKDELKKLSLASPEMFLTEEEKSYLKNLNKDT